MKDDDKLIFEITINNNVICKRHWILTGDLTYDNFAKVMAILTEELNVKDNTKNQTYKDDVNIFFKTDDDDILFHHIIPSERSNFKINLNHRLGEIRTLLGAEKTKHDKREIMS